MEFAAKFFGLSGILKWICKLKTVHIELVKRKKFKSSVSALRFLIYIWEWKGSSILFVSYRKYCIAVYH
jgi:hypothetical protein